MENEVNNQLPAIYDDALIEAALNAEKRITAVQKIKIMSLRVTNPQDWVDEGGKPYLQASGSQKVARLFGISWTIDPPLMIVDEDQHFRYEFKGLFTMGGVSIEAMGIRSSRDPFFRGKKDNPKPPSEIDKGNVQKAALTNCIGNGVTSLLGLKNLTWNDVAEAGINKGDTNRVEFGKSEMSGDAQDKRKELETMLNEMGGGDPVVASRLLVEYTTFVGTNGKQVPGKTKLEDLSEKAIPVTHQKVKKMYDAWKAGQHGQSSNSQTNSGGKAEENKA